MEGLALVTAKVCTKCGELKAHSEFYKARRRQDGLTCQCKLCMKLGRNKANRKAYAAKHYQENKKKYYEKARKYKLDNPEKTRESDRKYAKKRAHVINAKTARRRAAKLKATPKWLTEDQKQWILWYYKQAKAIEALTGVPHHVDHIHPLQGKTVRGLHVPWNLQVIPARENESKNNRLILNNEPEEVGIEQS